MKSAYHSGHLHNHLDPSSSMPEEEFEYARSEYRNDRAEGAGRSKLARGAGLVILLLVLMFLLQRYLLPVGPDLSAIFRMIPLTGAVLVLIIGLGLLSRARSVRKKDLASDWKLKDEEYSEDENVGAHADSTRGEQADEMKQAFGEKEKAGGGKKDASGPDAEQASDRHHHDQDAYGFRTYRKWYRSNEEKMLFGVCGGIAERMEVDPTIVRALFALAFLSYGFSLVIYLVLAVVLPKKPQHSLL